MFALLSALPARAAPGLKEALVKIGNAEPKPASFILCHGRDCRKKTRITLKKSEWRRVARLFPAKSAEAERRQIARAIGLLEQMTGKKAGTAGDLGGTFDGAFSSGQMDCEDETLNTGTYLTMLESKKLLRFHALAGRAHRGNFLTGWPHRAVRIAEKKTKKLFVVDSWFHANGKPAEVVPLARWEGGWRPE